MLVVDEVLDYNVNLLLEFVVMSVYLSVTPRIITTLLFRSYTYNWVMLLIVLNDYGVMLVQMTWYMDGSVTTIHIMSLSVSVLNVGCDE